VIARPIGVGQSNRDEAFAYDSNLGGPRADGGEQESLLAERHEIENNLAERTVLDAWSEKAIHRVFANAMISMYRVFGRTPAPTASVIDNSRAVKYET
jgi:hypothetical protein